MPDGDVLLSNTDGTILAQGPRRARLRVPWRRPGPRRPSRRHLRARRLARRGGHRGGARGPLPILFIAGTWTAGAAAALLAVRRRRRLHGLFRLDFERHELIQDGRGFRRILPIQAIVGVSTPPALGHGRRRAGPRAALAAPPPVDRGAAAPWAGRRPTRSDPRSPSSGGPASRREGRAAAGQRRAVRASAGWGRPDRSRCACRGPSRGTASSRPRPGRSA